MTISLTKDCKDFPKGTLFEVEDVSPNFFFCIRYDGPAEFPIVVPKEYGKIVTSRNKILK